MRHARWFTLALIGSILGSMLGASTVQAASGDETSFASKINNERSSRGIPPLGWSDGLAQVARHHSQEMASQDDLHHNKNLGNEVQGWEVLGENVGYGGSVDDLHSAFMASAAHRDNILDTDYTLVGTGTVWKDGTLWVTEVFERPMAPSRASQSSSRRHHSSNGSGHSRSAASSGNEASTPPRRPVTAPVAAPPQPAANGGDSADLTRLMVSNLLGNDDPAVGTIGAPEILFATPTGASDIASMPFGPLARIIGRVSRQLLGA